MKKLKDILKIPSEYLDEERRKRKLEVQTKINYLLASMTMRLVLHSYALPEHISFAVSKIRKVYENISYIESSYIDAIKKGEYTDWLLQNRLDLEEEKYKFLALSKELYDLIAELEEAPICIRENFLMVKAEIATYEYLKEEWMN